MRNGLQNTSISKQTLQRLHHFSMGNTDVSLDTLVNDWLDELQETKDALEKAQIRHVSNDMYYCLCAFLCALNALIASLVTLLSLLAIACVYEIEKKASLPRGKK